MFISVQLVPRFLDQPLAWIRYKWQRKRAPPVQQGGCCVDLQPCIFYPRDYVNVCPDWNESSMNPQDSSMLMKLPWELRSYIYKLVLGGGRIHMSLVESHREGASFIDVHSCRDWRLDHCDQDCSRNDRMRRRLKGEKKVPNQSAALLRTCRRAYGEATPFLYSENVFSVTDNDSLFELERLFQPRRLHFITQLEMSYKYWQRARSTGVGQSDNDTEIEELIVAEFQRALGIIEGMQGLKTLCVHVAPRLGNAFARRIRREGEPMLWKTAILRGASLIIDEICASVPATVETNIYVKDGPSSVPSFLRGPHRVHGIEREVFENCNQDKVASQTD